MQHLFCTRCSKIWLSSRLFVTLQTYGKKNKRMSEKKKTKRRGIRILLALLLLVALVLGGVAYYYFYSPFSAREETQYVYIDKGDDIAKVYAMLDTIGKPHSLQGFKKLAAWDDYASHVKEGRYAIKPGASTKEVFRNLKNGEQEPLNVTVPSARTMESLAKTVASKLQFDSVALYKALTDPATCAKLGFDTVSIYCLFIPETYNMYWTVSVDGFLERMKKEHPLLTSGEDSIFAVLMAFSDQSDDALLEDMETCYALLRDVTGMHPPWGSMTGFRPTRLFYEALENGLDAEEAEKHLVEQFDILPEKARLLRETVEVQQLLPPPADKWADVYIGIPFCTTRCTYCSFSSGEIGKGERVEPYLEALFEEQQHG